MIDLNIDWYNNILTDIETVEENIETPIELETKVPVEIFNTNCANPLSISSSLNELYTTISKTKYAKLKRDAFFKKIYISALILKTVCSKVKEPGI